MMSRLLDLGRQPFKKVWDFQREMHTRVAAGEESDTWIVVEHEPVVTVGRQGKLSNILLSREALAAKGVDLFEIERGGDVTYHGPGQVVVYPILRLARFREVLPLVRKLEEAVIAVCARFGIEAERWGEHAGVWVGRDCICATGLAIRKMTSFHGIALNASTELDYDRLINPCGLTDRSITSLTREAGRFVSYDEAKDVLIEELARVFGVDFCVDGEVVAVPRQRAFGAARDDNAEQRYARDDKAEQRYARDDRGVKAS